MKKLLKTAFLASLLAANTAMASYPEVHVEKSRDGKCTAYYSHAIIPQDIPGTHEIKYFHDHSQHACHTTPSGRPTCGIDTEFLTKTVNVTHSFQELEKDIQNARPYLQELKKDLAKLSQELDRIMIEKATSPLDPNSFLLPESDHITNQSTLDNFLKNCQSLLSLSDSLHPLSTSVAHGGAASSQAPEDSHTADQE